ncbi:MAG TPA: PIG-L family deacetylase [Thermoanaerobaculia bacterium]|jgi:LmbE family N-acetylglucosaminyl deacetylase|nr:PIG-L family deacetylase [Thermoanaerobaculia bacterium]
MLRRTIALLVTLFIIPAGLFAQKPLDAANLQLALRKLTVVGSALYVAAHPDDENTALIAYLGNERLYRTGYLSMTRGDGGQNLLGDEKGELLGVIRTQELLAARRIDGGEQFFTRALDFGYSKNPKETLAIWNHDLILADVVWNIRRFQPDVIVTRFPTTGEGGHGHHTASAILAGEAFSAAADPTKFPEQLKYVSLWQPRRLFFNHFSFQQIKPDDPSLAKSLRLDIGAFNPLLGRSYTEIAGESRSQHKSQGFGAAERRGTLLNYFDQIAGDPATSDMFEGIDTTWSRYPGGEAVGKVLQQASDTFDPKNPSKTIPLLLQAYDLLDRLGAAGPWASHPWVKVKTQDLLAAIRGCAGLSIDVAAGDSSVTAGGSVPISVSVVNRSDYPFTLSMVASRYADPSKAMNTPLLNNQPVKTDLIVKLPPDFPMSQPYWLQKPPLKGSYIVDDQQLVGIPENRPAIPMIVTLTDNAMHTIIFEVPAVYRFTDAVQGERIRNVDVVPEVAANLESGVYVFPDGQSKPVTVSLRNFNGSGPVTVRLKFVKSASGSTSTTGWSVEPPSVPITFTKKGDEAHATFRVTPPAGETIGYVAAEVETADGKKMEAGITNIDYPHIPSQRVFSDSQARLVRVDVKKRGSHVGYVMGAGDDVPSALRQIGYDVTFITDDDLDRGDFARYDAIVTGVRAYNTRPRIRLAQPKLMEYVKNGGTLVVQYNSTSPQPLLIDVPGPYPFKVTSDRVTVEEAPVRFVHPDSPLLNTPNKITAADFNDWVQERGLYFVRDWDPQYQTVLASNDPGEPEKEGGELFAHYGKGAFVYTSYAWFRQLPAGVPGAYKLFANLVSAK